MGPYLTYPGGVLPYGWHFTLTEEKSNSERTKDQVLQEV